MRDEGVIKFQCRWQLAPKLVSPHLEELIACRNRLFDLGLVGVYADGIGFGNVSIRAEGGFVISGSQTGQVVKAGSEHFSAVTTYSIKENWVECSGPVAASSESLTHAVIYELFDWVQAVIHVHTNEGWKQLLGRVPTTAADVAYGTPAMAVAVRRLAAETDLVSRCIFAMAGHEDGVVSFGDSLQSAFDILHAAIAGDSPRIPDNQRPRL